MTLLGRRLFVAGCAMLPLAAAARSSDGAPASVMVIASMHGRMAMSRTYSYDDLYAAVARFAPDFVGVEIRQEDLGRPEAYLREHYPVEMITLAHRYAEKAFGFDWLGDEIEGRAIPDNWKEVNPIKRLEREMGQAELLTSLARERAKATVSALSVEQDRILESATVTSLSDGRYDRVTAAYYGAVKKLVTGTRFAELPQFYRRRDDMLALNVVDFVRYRPGKRTVVVTGGDHHGPIVEALKRNGRGVSIVPVS